MRPPRAPAPSLCRSLCAGLLALALLCMAPASAPRARERGGDGVFSERGSMHFLLLQDVEPAGRASASATRRFEGEVLAELENAHGALSSALGMRPARKLTVRIYDPAVFDRLFARAFGFRAAGFFDGTLNVRGSGRLDAEMVRTLHHEYTHAVVQAAAGAGRVPAWLNEGLAEYFGGLAVGERTLSPGRRLFLARASAANAWIPLRELRTLSLTHLSDQTAPVAYLESHAAIDWLVRRRGLGTLRRMCEQVSRSGNADRALRNAYGLTLDQLDAALRGQAR